MLGNTMTGIRTQQRLSTQKTILETARRLFLSASYASVGVREIATEANVATGTVISAYGSKADLLHEIVVEDIGLQLELMRASIHDDEDTYTRIRNICLAGMVFQTSRREILRASMADAWTRSDNAENKIRHAMRPLHRFIVHELERGVARGELRHDLNVNIGAILLIETLINTYRIPIYDDTTQADVTEKLLVRIDTILNGFGVNQHNLVEQAA